MKTKPQKIDRRGRILRSAEERQELIGRYKASGLNKVEFCRRAGLKVTTLHGWLSSGAGKGRQGITGSRKNRVKFAGVEVSLGKPAAIEIELPSKICIRLKELSVIGDLVKFIKEVGTC